MSPVNRRSQTLGFDPFFIFQAWILHVIQNPEREQIQSDGRIRRWAKIAENDSRVLRVVLLADGETVHNAFFDRGIRL